MVAVLILTVVLLIVALVFIAVLLVCLKKTKETGEVYLQVLSVADVWPPEKLAKLIALAKKDRESSFWKNEPLAANIHLIEAASDLLAAHEPDRQGPDFLEWVADRLVTVHGESPNVDFVLCLRRRASLARAALKKVG